MTPSAEFEPQILRAGETLHGRFETVLLRPCCDSGQCLLVSKHRTSVCEFVTAFFPGFVQVRTCDLGLSVWKPNQ